MALGLLERFKESVDHLPQVTVSLSFLSQFFVPRPYCENLEPGAYLAAPSRLRESVCVRNMKMSQQEIAWVGLLGKKVANLSAVVEEGLQSRRQNINWTNSELAGGQSVEAGQKCIALWHSEGIDRWRVMNCSNLLPVAICERPPGKFCLSVPLIWNSSHLAVDSCHKIAAFCYCEALL